MFQNYLKTAFRSILRERYYALIKVAGLALGLGTTLVIFLYVSHQLSYDKFQPYRPNVLCVATNIWDLRGAPLIRLARPLLFGLLMNFGDRRGMRLTHLMVRCPQHQRDGSVSLLMKNEYLQLIQTFFILDFKLKEGDRRTRLSVLVK